MFVEGLRLDICLFIFLISVLWHLFACQKTICRREGHTQSSIICLAVHKTFSAIWSSSVMMKHGWRPERLSTFIHDIFLNATLSSIYGHMHNAPVTVSTGATLQLWKDEPSSGSNFEQFSLHLIKVSNAILLMSRKLSILLNLVAVPITGGDQRLVVWQLSAPLYVMNMFVFVDMLFQTGCRCKAQVGCQLESTVYV